MRKLRNTIRQILKEQATNTKQTFNEYYKRADKEQKEFMEKWVDSIPKTTQNAIYSQISNYF